MKKDSLGDRMKNYENVNRNYLMSNSDVIIRIDWKAFSTFTKWLDKPFDDTLISTMQNVVRMMAKEISGFKLAYLQSDEISIWINDTDTIQTQGWFDYNINKINSVCASMFTGYFNYLWVKSTKIWLFDCRCFNIPREEIPNYFLRRQKDRYRNSVQMYARSKFKQKELQGKKLQDIFDMLFVSGNAPRTSLENVYKNGTFILKGWEMETNVLPTYDSINGFIQKVLSSYNEQWNNLQTADR